MSRFLPNCQMDCTFCSLIPTLDILSCQKIIIITNKKKMVYQISFIYRFHQPPWHAIAPFTVENDSQPPKPLATTHNQEIPKPQTKCGFWWNPHERQIVFFSLAMKMWQLLEYTKAPGCWWLTFGKSRGTLASYMATLGFNRSLCFGLVECITSNI